MQNRYFSQTEFNENLSVEMASAEDVYKRMQDSGMKPNTLIAFDFTFISNDQNNLKKLQEFLLGTYGYNFGEIQKDGQLWELSGVSKEFPVTSDNLLYWVLDLYKKAYQFECKLEAYGAMETDSPKFPDLNKEKEDFYFDEGLKLYNKGDLSGALINWSLAAEINPNDPNAYYSRGIVKDELYSWKAALEDYDKALEIAPDFSSALLNRGSTKDEHGDYQGALNDYDKIISLEKAGAENKKRAYFNRGNTKLNMKDEEGACQDWKKALELGAEYARKRIEEHCK